MDATATTLRARDRTLASLFKQHDANDDGVLDLEEFAALLTAVDPQQYPAVEKGAGADVVLLRLLDEDVERIQPPTVPTAGG